MIYTAWTCNRAPYYVHQIPIGCISHPEQRCPQATANMKRSKTPMTSPKGSWVLQRCNTRAIAVMSTGNLNSGTIRNPCAGLRFPAGIYVWIADLACAVHAGTCKGGARLCGVVHACLSELACFPACFFSFFSSSRHQEAFQGLALPDSHLRTGSAEVRSSGGMV